LWMMPCLQQTRTISSGLCLTCYLSW
jgi:hypothetical protein